MTAGGGPTQAPPSGGPPTEAPPRPPRPPRPPLHIRASYYHVPRRRRLWPTVVLWCVWVVVGAAVALAFGAYERIDNTLARAAPSDPEVARAVRRVIAPALPGEPVNVLLIGSDARPDEGDHGRSDSLILVRMDAERDFISMLSFPRDLYVNIPGYGQEKINSAYSVGGVPKTLETVEALTGEEINEYVNIDFAGFVRLVNAVGGVYADVDRHYFNDNSGPIKYEMLDLDAGYQRLNGEDGLDYVRYRYGDSDFARIARQQAFLSELKRQTKDFSNITKLNQLLNIFADNVETSIRDPGKAISLARLALTTAKERVARVSVRGFNSSAGGAAIVVAPTGEISQKVEEWKNPTFEVGVGEKRIEPTEVDVSVLNGNGRILAAQVGAEALRAKRFNASDGGNADYFGHPESSVFYAPGHEDEARAVRSLLGAGASIAPSSRSPVRLPGGVEVQVILGASFTGELSEPEKAPTDVPADTVETDDLVPALREAQRTTRASLTVMAPLKVARGSRVRIVRTYRVDKSGSDPWAVKVVFQLRNGAYWGVSEIDWKNPPILEGRTGMIRRHGREYQTFYDGKHLMRLAWTENGMTYWVSNTLDHDLSAKTIYEIAGSMRPAGRARLARNVTGVPMEVVTDGSTR